MLQELHIKNFAIIEDLSISFSPGLNILSGETGAGKSIIVGALALLLGGRISAETIRATEEEAVVEALFAEVAEDEVHHLLESWGITPADHLVVRRVVSRAGKTKAFINGNMATLQMLRQLGMGLISFSGQHEHQVLLQTDSHQDMVDDLGDLGSLRAGVAQGYRRLREMYARRDLLLALERDKAQRKDLLCFQIQEIEDAHLMPEEEEGLAQEEKILRNAQKLLELSQGAYSLIYQDSPSAQERAREALARLKAIAAIDRTMSSVMSVLEMTLFHLEDIADSLREYANKIPVDQGRLEEIATRLDEIRKLKKKYGGSLEEVLHFKERAAEELTSIELNEEELNSIEKHIREREKEMLQLALELSKRREDTALFLSKKVERELRSLGMGKTIFRVRLAKRKEGLGEGAQHSVRLGEFWVSEKGLDTVEFFIGPNPGEELKPLAKIASGGELSRIILGLKRIVAQERWSSILIFDEVDSGIGGATAEVVGRKLKEISRLQQTLCITHLPQIASFADLHQSVYKEIRQGRTITLVKRLNSPQEREEEIARMLGGVNISSHTREHAREMLKGAQKSAREWQ